MKDAFHHLKYVQKVMQSSRKELPKTKLNGSKSAISIETNDQNKNAARNS